MRRSKFLFQVFKFKFEFDLFFSKSKNIEKVHKYETVKVLSHLSGFFSGLVFGHSEAMTQVEVEIQQRAVLQAQSFQGRAVDLRRQVA